MLHLARAWITSNQRNAAVLGSEPGASRPDRRGNDKGRARSAHGVAAEGVAASSRRRQRRPGVPAIRHFSEIVLRGSVVWAAGGNVDMIHGYHVFSPV